MSNMLSPYEQEVRALSDTDLAFAIEHLNERVERTAGHGKVARYTGEQKKVILAESSRRLRWGRRTEKSEFRDFDVPIVLTVEASEPDEAKASAEQMLEAATAEPMGVHFSWRIGGDVVAQ